MLGWIALAACRPGPQQGPPPWLLSTRIPPNGNARSAPLVAADQPDQAMLARALCDVLGECPVEGEESAAGGEEAGWDGEDEVSAGEGEEAGEEDVAEFATMERHIKQELVDFDADGRNEVLVRLSYSDVAIWHVLARRGDEYVSIYELADNGTTSLRATQNAGGSPLLIREHDCCCMYELDVLALQGDTFESLFSWGSSCQQGCDDGYEAYLMFDEAQRLTSIQLPEGVCGADGTTYIDTATWQPAAQ